MSAVSVKLAWQVMSKAADTEWVGKNKLPPKSKAKIPPFKTPRQLKMKNTSKASVRQDVVDVTETEQKESDSEDETQFGVVWGSLFQKL